MKGRAKALLAVLLLLIVIAAVVRVNSYSLALMAGGFREPGLISEGFSYSGSYPKHVDSQRWRASLAWKDDRNQLILMEQGFLGFWGLPQAPVNLSGEYEDLEFIQVGTVPAAFGFYGYDPTAFPDSMVRDNAGYDYQHIYQADAFYHGTNALKTLAIPEDALPRDCTVQIYQQGAEYVLHLCMYCKGSGSFDGGFEGVYQSLIDNGCVEG